MITRCFNNSFICDPQELLNALIVTVGLRSMKAGVVSSLIWVNDGHHDPNPLTPPGGSVATKWRNFNAGINTNNKLVALVGSFAICHPSPPQHDVSIIIILSWL